MPKIGADTYLTPDEQRDHRNVQPYKDFDQTTPYFHVTSPENRERIRQWGLLPSRPVKGLGSEGVDWSFQPEGIYLHENPTRASEWENMGKNVWKPGEHGDVWEVDPSYIDPSRVVADKILSSPVVQHPIPPEALRLREDLGRTWDPYNIEGKDYWKPWPEGDPRLYTSAYDTERYAGRSQKEWETLQNKMNALYGPSESQVIHTWPDGWTIQQHDRPQDIARIGELMANCWRGGRKAPFHYTLHDPEGRPKIALDAHGQEGAEMPEKLGIPLGAFNTYPTDSPKGWQYLNRLTDWAQQNGYDRYTAHTMTGTPMEWPFETRKWKELPRRTPEQEGAIPARLGEPERIGAWKSLTHSNINTGLPCNCTFYKPPAPTMWREAAKIDKLRKEMTNPEQEMLLQHFEHLAERVPKLDPLLPWMAREVKKGGLNFDEELGNLTREPLGTLRASDGYKVNIPELRHMADWYADTRAPNRKGFDIMQHSFPEVGEKVHEYDKWLDEQQALADQKEAESAPIAHQYPDGWTLRQLRGKDLDYEGNAMGHCVGSYGSEVDNGNRMIYSLRDPNHVPHATMELEPTEWENPNGVKFTEPGSEVVDPVPQNARIEQIQGKGNEVPKPEYQERLKQWFETMPEKERPYWDTDSAITHPEDLLGNADAYQGEGYGGMGGYGPHGDYGVKNKSEIYYGDVLDNMIPDEWGGQRGYMKYDPRDVYHAALKNEEIPKLAKELEKFDQEQNENFMDWRDMNYEHLVPYYEDYPEDEYPLELPGGETIENPQEHQKAYYEDLEYWENEHPGMEISKELYRALAPHWFPNRYVGINNEPGYVNTIHPDPSAYVLAQQADATEPRGYRYVRYNHPAQEMWEKGEVPEHPTNAAVPDPNAQMTPPR